MAIINAASLSQSDVRAAIASSASGDIIQMPAGSGVWSFNYASGITAFAITGLTYRTLQGAGVNQTTIVDSATGRASDGLILLGDGSALSNFSIYSDPTGYSRIMVNTMQAQNFKIGNMKFLNVPYWGVSCAGGGTGLVPKGVIYESAFEARSGATTFQLIRVIGADNNIPPKFNNNTTAMAGPPRFGTDEAVFVEDCSFNQFGPGDATIETYRGGKLVVRYCTGNNFVHGIHGRDSSSRTAHFSEIYKNNFNQTINNYQSILTIRGGTMLVWGNVLNTSGSAYPTSWNKIDIQAYRNAGRPNSDAAWESQFPYNGSQLNGGKTTDGNFPFAIDCTGIHNGPNNSTTLIDTTKSWTPNLFVQLGPMISGENWLSPLYVINLDKDGRFAVSGNTSNAVTGITPLGTGDFIWPWQLPGNVAGSGTWDSGDRYVITDGYPGLDQPGWTGPTSFFSGYSRQGINPIRSWMNLAITGAGVQQATVSGAFGIPGVVSYLGSNYTGIHQPDSSKAVAENREYYHENILNDGQSGVGVGPLSSRPTTGVDGAAYWATDTSTLYIASGDQWSNYYTPYTYPHPLRGPFYALVRMGRFPRFTVYHPR